MKRTLCVGVLLLASCVRPVPPESLEQALERLAQGRDAVGDATFKATSKMTMLTGPIRSTGGETMDVQYLRDGEARLLRLKERMVQTMRLPDGKRRQVTMDAVVVFDGKFAWTELEHSLLLPRRTVFKDNISKQRLDRLGFGSMSLLAGLHLDLRERFRDARETSALKLVGRGTAAGRATTIIEATLKAEALANVPAQDRASTPARTVTHFDDASGFPLALKAYSAAGKEMISFAATDLRLNAGVARRVFDYTPPKGVQVRDLTKGKKDP